MVCIPLKRVRDFYNGIEDPLPDVNSDTHYFLELLSVACFYKEPLAVRMASKEANILRGFCSCELVKNSDIQNSFIFDAAEVIITEIDVSSNSI